MRHRRTISGALAAVVCAALVAACGGAQKVADSPPDSSATTTPAPPTASSSSGQPSGPSSSSSGAQQLPAGFGPGPPGSGLGRFYDQHVTWTDCGGGDTCADIWVPLDYSAPNGPAITLKAKRDPATDQAHKVGSLFINPGGPGASGIDYLGYANFDTAITDVYDVIGFDPRGVASSTPIDCVSDSQLDAYLASDPTPDTPAEISQMQKMWAHFTAGCEARSGPLLQHVSTVEVARDLDILRALVGDRKLNFFGASYGTYIGATYAALFPKRVGRMVLDGAVDPLASPHSSFVTGAIGFETALTAYLTYCVSQGDCPLGGDVDTARSNLVALLKQLDAKPLPTADGRPLTEGLGFIGTFATLYSRSDWSVLTEGLADAVKGRGDILLAISDAYSERQPDGTYKGNLLEALPAVNCLDHPEHESLAQIEAGAAHFDKVAPVFGPSAAWDSYSCSNWPEPRIQPVPDFSAKGAAPILVLGTTRDPATPYQQAVNLAHELDSGVLLSRDGDGHTAYSSGNTCIDDAVDAYLANATVPPDGKTC
jgi:pimeloyl-ACP methyl ester carboxylesterase